MSLLPASVAALLFLAVSSLLCQQIKQDAREGQLIRERQVFEGLIDSQDDEKAEVAKRRAAEESTREFLEKFNTFASEYNRLGSDYSAKGVWNTKQAAKVTKLWRKLHDDPAWMEKDKKKQ